MSSYQVLARKCRPQRFSEIVGQEHITRTLQNAIKQDRVGHAYLFVGSRGIGKTTSARIFAKALNCESGDKVIEPCCACQSCLEIAAGTSLDVQEIDGASHNKVEHVRELREGVQYTPNRGRYRIYIIDEVHMLTPQAWNALLKTLEEPPPHVKFFFATTEPHKVLPTIVSRCQRFDLKRLSVKLIAGRLREIARTENVAIDEGALVAIARAADGGMRDAQSIFDQIIAFCAGNDSRAITESDVTDVFGLASGRELATLAAAVLGNQTDDALTVVGGLAERGRDLERFYSDFVLFFRNVMMAQVRADSAGALDVSQAELDDIMAIAKQTPPPLIRRGLEALVAEEYRLKMALNKRVYLEVALVKVMDDLHSVRLDDVIRRLNQIRGTEELPETAAVTVTAPRVTLPPRADAARPETDPAEGPPMEENRQVPASSDIPAAVKAPPPSAEIAPPQAPPAEPAAVRAAPVETPSEASGQGGDTHAETVDEFDPEDYPEEEDMDADVAEGDVESFDTMEAKAAELLTRLIGLFKKDPTQSFRIMVLEKLRPVGFRSGVLEVAYPQDLPDNELAELKNPEMEAFLNDRLVTFTGDPTSRILIKRWKDGVSDEARGRRLVSTPEVMERVKKNAFVQEVVDLFQGEIIDVRGKMTDTPENG
ncbi:MAG: DNA polymerase III subunit gamma/tau [Lentisphaeria bacterium]|nr:DNA polymerase III subunit gamma/tau [Lentisphaeria bacterium]